MRRYLRHIHFETWMIILGGMITVYGAVLLWAQTPSTSCETQVADQYRHLVTDQVLSTQAATWGDQLATITGELRLSKTQLELKQGQLQQAERNLAMLVERQRQLTQTIAQQRAEIEQHKAGMPQPEKPPAN